MSHRLRSAEQSARRDSAAARLNIHMVIADSTAPRDPRFRGDHFRTHLKEAHRTIEILQTRIADLEGERDKLKQAREYDLSLCVTRREAEEARLAAFRLARGKASSMAEGRDNTPTPLSHAIDSIPDPQPKWSK